LAEVMGHNNQKAMLVISNVKVPGFAAIVNWTIAFTKDSVYFFRQGSNYIPLAYGAVADVYMSFKYNDKDAILISDIESNSKFYIKVQNSDMAEVINIKNKPMGIVVSFEADDKTYKLPLTGKKAKKFIEVYESMVEDGYNK
jgi:hypothetical protein